MTSNADRYRRWFDYERDAHQKVLASLFAIPQSARMKPFFQKAVDLFAHLVAARALWLHRLGHADEHPADLFPRDVAFDALPPSVDHMHSAWAKYLEGVDDVELSRVFEYTSSEGDKYQNRVEDILTQMFGHSWYHRGQMAQLVRSGGFDPAVTDFVFWTREATPSRAAD